MFIFQIFKQFRDHNVRFILQRSAISELLYMRHDFKYVSLSYTKNSIRCKTTIPVKGGDVLSFLPKGLTACLHKIKTRKIVKIQIQIIAEQRVIVSTYYPRADTFCNRLCCTLTDFLCVNIFKTSTQAMVSIVLVKF